MLVSTTTDTAEIPRISSRPSRRLQWWAGFGAAYVSGILTVLSVVVSADWEPDIVALSLIRLLAGVLGAVALVAWLGRQACLWIVSRLAAEIGLNRIAALDISRQLEQDRLAMLTIAASVRDLADEMNRQTEGIAEALDELRAEVARAHAPQPQPRRRRRTRGRRSRRLVVGIDGEVQEAARTIARRLVHPEEHL